MIVPTIVLMLNQCIFATKLNQYPEGTAGGTLLPVLGGTLLPVLAGDIASSAGNVAGRWDIAFRFQQVLSDNVR